MKKNSKRKSGKSSKAKKTKDLTIPYVVYFNNKVKEGRLNFWQLKEIEVFFKQYNLTDRELIEDYDKILNLY